MSDSAAYKITVPKGTIMDLDVRTSKKECSPVRMRAMISKKLLSHMLLSLSSLSYSSQPFPGSDVWFD